MTRVYEPAKYDKIVRDHIPDLILASGAGVVAEVVDDAIARQYLVRKLMEELAEYDDDNGGDKEELVDLYEVVVALAAKHGIGEESLKQKAHNKRTHKGGFARNIILKETT